MIDNFLRQATNGTIGTVYTFATATLYVVPALIGIFWGAPLIARELETGTHRLAWNQSVTRTRWLATKLAIVGAAAAATAGLLSWAVTAWAHQIDRAADNRIGPELFGARGIVPIGYAFFAFALGVTVGMLIRRTVPAMAATLGIYIAATISMEQWIRARLLSASQSITPLDTSSLDTLMFGDGSRMSVIGAEAIPGVWVLSNETITATGEVFTGPADPQSCGFDSRSRECEAWLDTLGLRQEITYHPANHFWPLQWAETGMLLAAAVLLAGFCFWWTRRRLT